MNLFGRHLRLEIFGESHGKVVGVTIDGCPAGLKLSIEDFLEDLGRRQGGKKGTTPRKETDEPEIISGLFNGFTTGRPITILFKNKNTDSKVYKQLYKHPRPGHADFVANEKYGGFQDYRGGGAFSGRMTVAIVAAGIIAKKLINPIGIKAKIISVKGSENIEDQINMALSSGNSVGGIIECKAENVPVGLGEPFFDSVESQLAHMMFSIPAIKGIEFGAGFNSANMLGSECNDPIVNSSGNTSTNNSGGINGGITNGNHLIFRVVIRPTPSISAEQKSYSFEKDQIETLEIKGRHDACIALRVPPIIEAGTAFVLADLMMAAGKVPKTIGN